MICPLGLICDLLDDFSANEECVNIEYCSNLSAPFEIYELIKLTGLPWIYLKLPGAPYDWCSKQYGFTEISNADWLLYLSAKMTPYEVWENAYYKFNRRGSAIFIRSEYFDQLDALRQATDENYKSVVESIDDIPF